MLDLIFEEIESSERMETTVTEITVTEIDCNIKGKSKKVKEWEESLALNGGNLQY